MLFRNTLGGTCVNVGCVPSKNLLRWGQLRYYARHRESPGITAGTTTLDFNRIFGQMYSHMEITVTLLQRSDRIIPEEDPAVSDAVRQYLEAEAIKIKTGVQIKRVYQTQGEKVIVARDKSREFEARASELLVAAGRDPSTSLLGLETVPVGLRKDGAVKVDREMHTTARHVWAAGDVIGEPILETIAAKEGATAAENALMGTHRKIDFLPVPRAIFTSPQVASVGLTEKQAHEQGYECRCRTIPMSKVPKAVVIRDTRGVVKMVVDASRGRILGVHILAENAADIIHEAVLAVKYKLTIDDIIDTVHVFPTITESIKLVATSFRKDIDELSCCAE